VAFVSRQYLAAIESIAGAIASLQCSLILPVAIYAVLAVRHGHVSHLAALGMLSGMTLGVSLMVFIVPQAVTDALHGEAHL
jgi:hypothetical protein